MCGGCNGPSKKIQVSRETPKKEIIQTKISRAVRQSTDTPQISLSRQAIVRNDKCPKCSNQIMLVNIAGRERKQCISCRFILK